MSESAPVTRKGLALLLLAAAQFIVVLDASIVNVALPSMGRDLGFSQEDLSWVVNAYTLTFGGFLLLGGRIGRPARPPACLRRRPHPLLHRLAGRRVSPRARSWLVAARAVQGLGAAILSPAALSIITTTFAEGAERNRAMGVWGAVAGSGGAAGVLFGGLLTEYAGWEWVLFVNVPIGIAVAFFATRVLPESKIDGPRHFDAAGAVTITAGLSLLVYALVDTVNAGWGSTQTIVADRDLARADRGLRRDRVALEEPARLVRDLPQPDADGRQRGRAARGDVAVLDVLLRLALHAAGARLRRAEGGPRLPAAGVRDHRLGRRRLGARDARRLQADADRRAAADRRRPDLVLPGLARTASTSPTSCRRRCSPRSGSASRSCR